MKKTILLLFFTQAICAEEIQEGVAYSYPYIHDESDIIEEDVELSSSTRSTKKKQASAFDDEDDSSSKRSKKWRASTFDKDDDSSSKRSTKKKPASVFEGKMGNADVVIDVGNTDFESQCKSHWKELKRRRGELKDEKKSEDDEEENHSLNANFSIKFKTS